MNRYEYAEIQIGQTACFYVNITEDMMRRFYLTTGDCNPMHQSEGFAIAQSNGKYNGKVVYGMLTASFFSTLAGVYLPGENSLIHRVEAEFPNPVYVGDTITIIGEVVDKNDTFRTIEVKATIKNQTGQKVCRGKLRIGVLK